MKRPEPPVEALYGTPRKALTLSWMVPRILPAVVSTMGPDESPVAGAAQVLASAPLIRAPAASVPRLRNDRRGIKTSWWVCGWELMRAPLRVELAAQPS